MIVYETNTTQEEGGEPIQVRLGRRATRGLYRPSGYTGSFFIGVHTMTKPNKNKGKKKHTCYEYDIVRHKCICGQSLKNFNWLTGKWEVYV